MKKIQIYFLTIFILFGASCEHDKLDTYSDLTDDIYFEYAFHPLSTGGVKYDEDSTTVRFGYDTPMKSDSTIKIKMRLLGDVVDYDRPINFTLEESESVKLGRDVELLHDQSCLKADSIYGYIYIKIKNNGNLGDTTLLAKLRTMPNEHFRAEYDEVYKNKDNNKEGKIKSNTYRVFYTAKNSMPLLWAASELRFRNVFGTYSDVKFDFIIKTLRLDYSLFVYNPETEVANEVFAARFPISKTNGWKLLLRIALEQYEEEHGEALKDENGKYVEIGGFKPKAK